MLTSPLCEMLHIEHPIILAPMGSATSAEFAAVASNAGGLGSIATLGRPTDAILRDLALIRALTDRPFAVNHVPQTLDEVAFQATLDLRPAVISFALGDPGDLVERAHAAGATVMLQVTTVAQARLAVERGVDVVIAQGGEAGGYGGVVGTLALVPQVVDAVAPLPVVAAGGIFDGRGIAAAFMLGAVGVNLGTRFLASPEAPIEESWRQAILIAAAEDAIKADALNAVRPLPGEAGFGTVLRSLRTPFLEEWNAKLDEARHRRERLDAEMATAVANGRRTEFLATAGQAAGGINDVQPVAAIIAQLVAETEIALARAPRFVG